MNVIKPGMYRIDTRPTQTRAPQFYQTFRNTNPCVSTSTGVIHITSVSRPQLRINQMKDKVVQNNSQVKIKQKEVEDHHRISSFSNKKKSVTACNDSLKSKTSNVKAIVHIILFIVDSGCTKHMTRNLKLLCNFVEKYLGTVRLKNDQFAPILGYEDLVYRNIMIKRVYYVEGLNHNLFSGNDLLTGNCGSDLYTISLQETSSPPPICFMAKTSPTQAWLWHRRLSHLNFDTINLLSKNDIVNGLPKLKYVKDQLCPSCEMGKANRNHSNDPSSSKLVPNGSPLADTTDPSLQELDLLFIPMYEEYFTVGNQSVSKSSALSDNSQQQDTQPTMNVQPILEPNTPPTNINAEETNTDQAADGQFEAYEFINPFCTQVQEVTKSSSCNIDTSNMHTIYQRHRFDYHYTRVHLLEQLHRNPSKPVQTRRQLSTDPKICMFALTVSTAEPKNIKESMADQAWIKAMQEELH
ncbi:integrase, catalytic region, zinc finger, CCHC-type containing protein [Tanacetum coccineum]